MSLVGKNQLLERVSPRLRTFHTDEEGNNNRKGTVAWYKAYLKKDYCQSTIGYACQRSSAGGSGVGGQGQNPRTVQRIK